MPKVTFNVGDMSDVDAAQSKFYDGEVPPKGTYRTKVALCKLKTTQKGDPMLTFVFEIAEPKGSDKSRYNGYGIWHNAVLLSQSAPFINGMLDGLGIARPNLWRGGVVTDPKDEDIVVRIGKVKVAGLTTVVNTKRRIYNDEPQLSIVNFFKDDDGDDGDVDDLGEGASMEEPEEAVVEKAPAKRKPKAKPAPEPEPEDDESEFDDGDDSWDDDESSF